MEHCEHECGETPVAILTVPCLQDPHEFKISMLIREKQLPKWARETRIAAAPKVPGPKVYRPSRSSQAPVASGHGSNAPGHTSWKKIAHMLRLPDVILYIARFATMAVAVDWRRVSRKWAGTLSPPRQGIRLCAALTDCVEAAVEYGRSVGDGDRIVILRSPRHGPVTQHEYMFAYSLFDTLARRSDWTNGPLEWFIRLHGSPSSPEAQLIAPIMVDALTAPVAAAKCTARAIRLDLGAGWTMDAANLGKWCKYATSVPECQHIAIGCATRCASHSAIHPWLPLLMWALSGKGKRTVEVKCRDVTTSEVFLRDIRHYGDAVESIPENRRVCCALTLPHKSGMDAICGMAPLIASAADDLELQLRHCHFHFHTPNAPKMALDRASTLTCRTVG